MLFSIEILLGNKGTLFEEVGVDRNAVFLGDELLHEREKNNQKLELKGFIKIKSQITTYHFLNIELGG